MMKKLMERVRMIRENQKKNGTKGFSMIELIIVIAVMAILIALIGTQLIPYLEKSRKTRDLDTMNAMLTAIQSVCTDAEIVPDSLDFDNDILGNTANKTALETYLGYTWGADKFSSKAAGTKATNAVEVKVVQVDGKAAIMVEVGDLWITTAGLSSAKEGATKPS